MHTPMLLKTSWSASHPGSNVVPGQIEHSSIPGRSWCPAMGCALSCSSIARWYKEERYEVGIWSVLGNGENKTFIKGREMGSLSSRTFYVMKATPGEASTQKPSPNRILYSARPPPDRPTAMHTAHAYYCYPWERGELTFFYDPHI